MKTKRISMLIAFGLLLLMAAPAVSAEEEKPGGPVPGAGRQRSHRLAHVGADSKSVQRK